MESSKWATDPAKDTPKSTFTLNPAAPEYSFTPSPAPTPQQAFTPQSYPDEDEFASQTRAQDDLDLFDDDFEPIQHVPPPQEPVTSVPRGEGRGGRGRGGRGTGGFQQEPAGAATARPTTYTDVRLEETSPTNPTSTTDDTNPPPPTTDEPTPTRPRIEAVRGDRSKTGGLKKAKLTEEELTERMAVMKLKNATRTADYERAAADEASFREREIQAQVKRAEEFRNRQQMDKEREKNAARKLKAMGGREWDTEKSMEEERDGRRSQFRRGAFGGVVVSSGSRTPVAGSEDVAPGWGESTDAVGWTGSIPPPSEAGESSTRPDLFEDRQRDEYRGGGGGRGRGGRGRGGYEGRGGGYEGLGGRGRGRGRGSGANTPNRFNATTEDFPALGSAATKNTNTGSSAWGASTSTSTTTTTTQTKATEATKPEWDKPTPSGDWADEMAQPVEGNSTQKW